MRLPPRIVLRWLCAEDRAPTVHMPLGPCRAPGSYSPDRKTPSSQSRSKLVEGCCEASARWITHPGDSGADRFGKGLYKGNTERVSEQCRLPGRVLRARTGL